MNRPLDENARKEDYKMFYGFGHCSSGAEDFNYTSRTQIRRDHLGNATYKMSNFTSIKINKLLPGRRQF
jgi:hypothetical protein